MIEVVLFFYESRTSEIRKNTFFDSFGAGVEHTPMAKPFDEKLREALYLSASELGNKVHKTGTVITVEDPRFSTKAESNMFRCLGADIIKPESVEIRRGSCSIGLLSGVYKDFQNIHPVFWKFFVRP